MKGNRYDDDIYFHMVSLYDKPQSVAATGNWLLYKTKKTNSEIKHELDRRESDTQIDDP